MKIGNVTLWMRMLLLVICVSGVVFLAFALMEESVVIRLSEC